MTLQQSGIEVHTMRAMQLAEPGGGLEMVERAISAPSASQVLVEVLACGVCRTDLHVIDGDIEGSLPIVPGHEIVGRIIAMGEAVSRFAIGERIGIPWLASTCGHCRYCTSRRENLCDRAAFTGFTVDGGYASHALAKERFCFGLPPAIDDVHAAPLLCAGLIGYRAFAMTEGAETIGLYGFGAAAHIIAQLAVGLGCRIAAFTKPADGEGQQFARKLGCAWAGGSDELPPFELDSAIIFAPVGALVPVALAAVRKGGKVVCAGIHMSDIPSFPYDLLWGERTVQSVANLTRADGTSFFAAIAEMPIETHVECFALEEANEALKRLRQGTITGAAVLIP
jgi:propanol-preferring alcohol dehydrogenase